MTRGDGGWTAGRKGRREEARQGGESGAGNEGGRDTVCMRRRQQTAAHQTIVDKVVTCYDDPLVLSTVQNSHKIYEKKSPQVQDIKTPVLMK